MEILIEVSPLNAVTFTLGTRVVAMSAFGGTAQRVRQHLAPGQYRIDDGHGLDVLTAPDVAAAIREALA